MKHLFLIALLALAPLGCNSLGSPTHPDGTEWTDAEKLIADARDILDFAPIVKQVGVKNGWFTAKEFDAGVGLLETAIDVYELSLDSDGPDKREEYRKALVAAIQYLYDLTAEPTSD